jgi:hypothetical protein
LAFTLKRRLTQPLRSHLKKLASARLNYGPYPDAGDPGSNGPLPEIRQYFTIESRIYDVFYSSREESRLTIFESKGLKRIFVTERGNVNKKNSEK